MLSFLGTALLFFIVLSVLVLVHEYGHFIVARLCGVKVEEFGLGLPPKARKLFHHNGTDYTLNWLPLGGFVRLKGEQIDPEHLEDARGADSFASKPIWQRVLILVAGVAMNVVLVYVLLVAGLMIDSRAVIGSGAVGTLGEPVVMAVLSVEPGSSADLAGFQKDDLITSVDGKDIDGVGFPQYIKDHHDQSVSFNVERGDQKFQKNVTIGTLPGGNIPGLGIRFGLTVNSSRERFSFPAALVRAGQGTGAMAIAVLNALKSSVVNHNFQDLAGPVGIAVVTGEAARAGFVYIVILMSQLSMSLAIMNVLPIPALDGGRIFLAVIEKARGRAMRPAFENALHLIGFTVLICLILVITVKDIIHLF